MMVDTELPQERDLKPDAKDIPAFPSRREIQRAQSIMRYAMRLSQLEKKLLANPRVYPTINSAGAWLWTTSYRDYIFYPSGWFRYFT